MRECNKLRVHICTKKRKCPATRCATTTASAASVLDHPPTERMAGYTVVLLVSLEHSVAATCYRLSHPPAAVSGRVWGRRGARRWLHAGARRAECACRWKRVGHVASAQKPACARCVLVPRSNGGVGERLRAKDA